jgi:hypothetical protein
MSVVCRIRKLVPAKSHSAQIMLFNEVCLHSVVICLTDACFQNATLSVYLASLCM